VAPATLDAESHVVVLHGDQIRIGATIDAKAELLDSLGAWAGM
jgi:hypothetical protein